MYLAKIDAIVSVGGYASTAGSMTQQQQLSCLYLKKKKKKVPCEWFRRAKTGSEARYRPWAIVELAFRVDFMGRCEKTDASQIVKSSRNKMSGTFFFCSI